MTVRAVLDVRRVHEDGWIEVNVDGTTINLSPSDTLEFRHPDVPRGWELVLQCKRNGPWHGEVDGG